MKFRPYKQRGAATPGFAWWHQASLHSSGPKSKSLHFLRKSLVWTHGLNRSLDTKKSAPEYIQMYIYIFIYARPPPKIYLFDVWREFIYEINPLLSYLKWIRTWTPIQMAHTNSTHKPHTISYPNQTFCPIYITLPLTRYGDQIYVFFMKVYELE